MKRIDTSTRAIDLFGAGKDGYKDGNKGAGIPATDLNASVLNALQEEIANVIEGTGAALNPADNTQLLQAINSLVKGPADKIVRVASTAAINLAAPGANIDGTVMVAGDTFLEKDNATLADRGIYVWNGAAVPATRDPAADNGAELFGGMIIRVKEGTVNADTNWQVTNDGVVTIGVTGLTFQKVGGAVDASETVKGVVEKATTSEAQAFVADKYIDGERLGQVALGANQTWQNLSGSRAVNVTYTNTTGKPIQVNINLGLTSGNGLQLTVGGVQAATFSGNAVTIIYGTLAAIVPNNTSYALSFFAGSAIGDFGWSELR